MPRDETAPVVKAHNRMYYGEEPRTTFLDWFDAIRVTLMHGPDKERIALAMAAMREASYSPDLTESLRRAELSVSDQIAHPLSLAVEVPSFLFLISGVSRTMTHQIVRTRIGVTYAQKCTGDGDIRHDSCLVPRGRWRESEHMLEWSIGQVLSFKMWYAKMIDSGESIHVGREFMPHNLSQYIYMNISLLALMEMYGKRMCPEQPSQWQRICSGMKRSLEECGYPEFAKLLVSNCERGTCHWKRKGNNDPYLGRLYFPDPGHDREPWNPASFLHQGTVDLFEDGPSFDTREYEGMRRVR